MEADWRAMRLRSLASAVLVGQLVALGQGAVACGDEGPEALTGPLSFEDDAQGCHPTEGRLEQPVALGAELHVRAIRSQQRVDVEAATSSAPAVLEVREVGAAAELLALAEGTSSIDIEAGGTTGSLELTVGAVASSTVNAGFLTVYNFDEALDVPHPTADDDLLVAPLGLLPDGQVELVARLSDAEGTELIGHGAAAWSATEPGGEAPVTFEPAGNLDDNTLVTPKTAPEETQAVTVSASGGGSFDLLLHPTGAAASLDIYVPTEGQRGGQISFPRGQVRGVGLLVFDAEGHLLLGSGSEGFTSEILEGGEDRVAFTTWPWADDNETDDQHASRAEYYERTRVVFLEGLDAGTATLRLAAAGLSIDVPVVIEPEAPTPASL